MKEFLLAFGVHVSVCAFIYELAKKLQAVLTNEAGSSIKEALLTKNFSYFTQNWYSNATNVFDKIFLFRNKRGFYIASIRRVILWTLSVTVFLILLAELLYIVLQQNNPDLIWIYFLHESLFSNGLISFAFTAPILFLSILLVDFVNISKSRNIIKYTYGVRSRYLFSLIAADLILTFVVSAILTFAISYIWMMISIWGFETLASIYYNIGDETFLNSDGSFSTDAAEFYYRYGHPLGLIITPMIFSFITSALIFLIYIFTALIILVMRLTHDIDRLKSASVFILNWDEKPVLAAGVLLISILTLFFIPMTIILYLARII